MINFYKDGEQFFLRYESEDMTWIDEKLKSSGLVTIARVFSFEAKHLKPPESELERVFCLGIYNEDGYCRIDKEILGLSADLLISDEIKVDKKVFIAEKNISIFRKIDSIVAEPIIVGGSNSKAISRDDFNLLIKNFPTSTELKHYANARVSRILQDYFESMTDSQKKLERILKQKPEFKQPRKVNVLKEYEVVKYQYIRNELNEMLENSSGYVEKDWQRIMLEFLLLIFPKYIAVLENVRVKDFSNPSRVVNRFIDIALVDAGGNLDIIEIKQPFNNSLLTSKPSYRDNYTPKKELSGTVVQVEKYLFHLNRWGVAGEKNLNAKYSKDIPKGVEIRVTNPKGLIISGRDNTFDKAKFFDFEIIKRKYSNIMDIITYDDLLRRLDNIIKRLS